MFAQGRKELKLFGQKGWHPYLPLISLSTKAGNKSTIKQNQYPILQNKLTTNHLHKENQHNTTWKVGGE